MNIYLQLLCSSILVTEICPLNNSSSSSSLVNLAVICRAYFFKLVEIVVTMLICWTLPVPEVNNYHRVKLIFCFTTLGSHLSNEGSCKIFNGATNQRNLDIFCQFLIKLIVPNEYHKIKFQTKTKSCNFRLRYKTSENYEICKVYSPFLNPIHLKLLEPFLLWQNLSCIRYSPWADNFFWLPSGDKISYPFLVTSGCLLFITIRWVVLIDSFFQKLRYFTDQNEPKGEPYENKF